MWWLLFAVTEVKIVKQMPAQAPGRKPTVAIITSRYYEKLAIDAMMEDKTTFVKYKTEGINIYSELHNLPIMTVYCQCFDVGEGICPHHHHHQFWQAPLRVHSTERRHQSPEWTVLSQVNCIVHIEVAGFQILLNGFHPCSTRTSQWSPPVSCRGSC